MLARRLIATAAIAAGLGVGVGATAQAAPAPAHTQNAAAVRPNTAHWSDMGYFNGLGNCRAAGIVYVSLGLGRAYYCAPMTDDQHYELSILRG